MKTGPVTFILQFYLNGTFGDLNFLFEVLSKNSKISNVCVINSKILYSKILSTYSFSI